MNVFGSCTSKRRIILMMLINISKLYYGSESKIPQERVNDSLGTTSTGVVGATSVKMVFSSSSESAVKYCVNSSKLTWPSLSIERC
uniref:Uncharacterized protein n=1 Tax=Amphimedon queenslandica TaxID=400682 RepID=A0A1X7U1I0_AMPQE